MGGDGFKMPRFFVAKGNILGNSILIVGDDVNHIKNVLRCRIGDKLIVCDGERNDYTVEIAGFEKDCVRTIIIEHAGNAAEPRTDITLFQCIPKHDKLDFIIQKGIELGVNRIVPVISERTIIKIENEADRAKKASRWRKIALEAAKQCDRGIIPEISLPISLGNAFNNAGSYDLCIIPYEKDRGNRLKFHINKGSGGKIALFIGPEGGFTETEIQTAQKSGISPVTLGPRILRTETAAIAVLSILMYELGEL